MPFVSTNDALTSWFFREMKCDINVMVANFRSRRPAILDLTEHHAGNYEANVPYFPGDVERPALIRQSILSPENQFRARRAGSPATKVPGFFLPILEPNGLITSVWHNGIVFCPRAGELGMLMITRRFDSDTLTQRKREAGSRVPMGAQLI